MNVPTPRRSSFRAHVLLAVVATAVAMLTIPRAAQAASSADDSGQTVECMLPGQIHTIAGHATMGARQPVQTTPADCRARGGEYTVDEHASQPQPVPHVPVASVDDARIVTCLLPRQTRQLGEKARYTTGRHSVRISRSDCQARGGDVIATARKPTRSHHAAPAKPTK